LKLEESSPEGNLTRGEAFADKIISFAVGHEDTEQSLRFIKERR
jgi:hypothetical protein